MEFKIRECRVEDFEAIYSLNKKEMGYDYPMEKTRDKLIQIIGDSTNRVYVATLMDVVIGYVHATDYDVFYAPHMKNIMGIAVTQEFKNYGIGRALLEKVEEWAKDTNATAVCLVSGASRIGAHKFYEKCGYLSNKEQLNFKKEII